VLVVGGARQVIRLFPDYCRDWPLWENSGGPAGDVGYTRAPSEYGLSEGLSDALGAWNDFWTEHFDPFKGWDAAANEAKWIADGRKVAAWLRREVAEFADVSYEVAPPA
jgi:hypothetical protein